MKPDTIKIDEVTYIRSDAKPVAKRPGTRAIVVVDRGWVFAGDVTRENWGLPQGRIRLSRALHVFKWAESVGFAGMIENTKKADLRKIADVEIPSGAEIFCVPVHDDWGL